MRNFKKVGAHSLSEFGKKKLIHVMDMDRTEAESIKKSIIWIPNELLMTTRSG